MWNPNKPVIARLLFDEPTVKPIVKFGDKGHYYWISQRIFESNILPQDYYSMKLVKISMDDKETVYRLTIWRNDVKKGMRVWRAYIVTLAGEGEFVFIPPLTNDLENK